MNEHEVRSLISRVEDAVSGAIGRALPDLAGADPVVRRSEHADFQLTAQTLRQGLNLIGITAPERM